MTINIQKRIQRQQILALVPYELAFLIKNAPWKEIESSHHFLILWINFWIRVFLI